MNSHQIKKIKGSSQAEVVLERQHLLRQHFPGTWHEIARDWSSLAFIEFRDGKSIAWTVWCLPPNPWNSIRWISLWRPTSGEEGKRDVFAPNFISYFTLLQRKRGVNKTWVTVEVYQSFADFESSKRGRELKAKYSTQSNRGGKHVFVCKYKRMRAYDCPVTVQVLQEGDGGVAVQLPDPEPQHDHELKGERTYSSYLDAKGTISHQNLKSIMKNKVGTISHQIFWPWDQIRFYFAPKYSNGYFACRRNDWFAGERCKDEEDFLRNQGEGACVPRL